MYKKILEKLANAGTVALIGYEIGSNVHDSEEKKENITQEKNHSEVIIIGLIILIILIIISRIYINKHAVV